MKKISLLVHPFYFIKGKKDGLSTDYMTVPENPLLQLRRLYSARAEEAGSRLLTKYMRGVDFAGDGVLLIVRADPYEAYLDVEKQLFSHSQQAMGDRVYFSPDFGKQKDDLRSQRVNKFLMAHFDPAEPVTDADLYAFGEDMRLCTKAFADQIRHRFKIRRKPRILDEYSEVWFNASTR